MDILLYRPLVTIRNMNRKKAMLKKSAKPVVLGKVFLEALKRATLLDIKEGTLSYAGKGDGPAFIRERSYLTSILPNEIFSSTQLRRNMLARIVLATKLLISGLPIFPRLFRLVKHLRNNNRLPAPDLEQYILFLTDFLTYQHFFKNKNMRPKGVVTHSLLSPRALSLVTAAISEKVPSLFILHGACKPCYPGIRIPTYPLDLHLIKNQASYDRIALNPEIAKRVAFYGLPGKEAPLRPIPQKLKTVGICLPYDVIRQDLENMLDCVFNTFVSETVSVRFHPRDPLGKTYKRENIRLSDRNETIQDFAKGCDLVIAGNTSAILDILKIGCPAVYVASLDNYGWDIYGFVSNKLIPGFEIFDQISIEETRRLYAANDWKDKMTYYDSSYGKNQSEIDKLVKNEILAIFRQEPDAC